MENKARYNVLDDKIVIIVTLPDKVRDRPLRCLRFHYSRYQISIEISPVLGNLITVIFCY